MYKPKGLQALFSSIERGETRTTMTKLFSISNTALGKRLQHLVGVGMIEQVQQRPYSLYKLTPLGNRVNQILGQSEREVYTNVWRCHNVILGWEIKDFGTWKFNEKLQKTMNNWIYQELKLKGYKIHIQSTGLLKLYCPEVYANNADEGFDKIVEDAKAVANYIASRYKMKIDNYHRVRNGQKEHFGSEKLAEFIGHMKVGGVFVDISDKQNRRLEADQDNYDIEKLFALPKEVAELKTSYKDLTEINGLLTEQIKLHLSVMQDMKETLKDIRDAVKQQGAKSNED